MAVKVRGWPSFRAAAGPNRARPRPARGYLSTAAKHGADVLTALRDTFPGRPWMPPIPART